jgi:2-oxoglutarate decarboxylase
VRRGDITLEEAESALDDFNASLQVVLDEVRGEPSLAPTELPVPEPLPADAPSAETGVSADVLHALSSVVRSVPDGFMIHPKLERQFVQRDQLVASGQVDWALAEALAIGSLMYEGVNVRLTGQDTRRGTFSHRHAVLVDYSNGEEFVPLAHIRDGLHRIGADTLEPSEPMGNFTVRDSLLSEYAAVGFEYGYSVEAPEALVAWEAQFGDFANGAQIIIDNFMVAAEVKWGQFAGLTLLAAPRLRGTGPRALVGALRALPVAVGARQPACDDPFDVGAVLPPVALTGAVEPEAAARRGHPQVDAAGPRVALDLRRAGVGLLPARDRRHVDRGPFDGPPHRAVQREDRP